MSRHLQDANATVTNPLPIDSLTTKQSNKRPRHNRPQPPSTPEISIPLLSLPLRPSTLTALLRSGFTTTGDVAQSLRARMNSEKNESERISDGSQNQNDDSLKHDHFAMEIGCSSSQAADYTCEIDSALKTVGLPTISLTTEETHDDPPSPPFSLFPATAAYLLSSKNTQNNPHATVARQIVSFSRPLDALLGGGIALSELTEIVGPPGSGKTQLAFQLCVDARLPSSYGGVEGCSVVIDSEGSWGASGVERCWDMAVALVDHVRSSARRKLEMKNAREGKADAALGPEEYASLVPEWFTPESILEGIHIFRVHDEASQTCTLYDLPRFLIEQEDKGLPVKLIVVDSMAFHYRMAASSSHSIRSINGKSGSFSTSPNVTRLATLLIEIASEFDLAVVAINHLTTKIDKDTKNGGGGTKLVPALGESWAHAVISRIMIDHRLHPESSADGTGRDVRICTLIKSPHKPQGTAEFIITDKGIRGVPSQNKQPVHH
mmetsp:Transcript_25125/g.52935  ORF Transcript_25125/g.52935 Transcript_25125/m.52935 type:complete len:492 (-) Transcript_25125:288-1763(-)